MVIFEERERWEEFQFVRGRHAAFEARVRRNRLFGRWAAERLGLAGEEAELYVSKLLLADDAALLAGVGRDLERHVPPIDPGDLAARLAALAVEARAAVAGRDGPDARA